MHFVAGDCFPTSRVDVAGLISSTFSCQFLLSDVRWPRIGYNMAGMDFPREVILGSSEGALIPLWMLVPFVGMLLSIALLPMLASSFWEHHYRKVAVVLAIFTAGCYGFFVRDMTPLGHALSDYVSFIALIGSLFVVAGGIHITVKGESTPAKNVLFLVVGAVLANVIGTTGASMLLIRPWLRMNQYRITAFHVVFFIFLISNVGGSLTPIGDPPLFIGYLKKIPFFWTLEYLFLPWLVGVSLLLLIFYIFDWINFTRAPKAVREKETAHETWSFEGGHNMIFLAIILGAVFIEYSSLLRDGLMILAAAGSYWTTSRRIHEANHFTFHPIEEVAWLFLGIFVTMVPALQYLEIHSAELGITHASQFYWMSGLLSGVLDNAPTYLSFLTSLLGLTQHSIDQPADVLWAVAERSREIMAISVGSVFFGALTYIGNGPNLMVKSIVERAGVRTPSFFEYILFYSIPILLPVLAIVGFIWFR